MGAMMHETGSAAAAVFERDGVRLSWESAGHGTPVLFVHGTAAPIWGRLPGRVAGFARAVTYARRGFGRSQASGAHPLSVHAEDAAGLLRAVNGGPAVLVGWSIGGVIALEVAARHPGLVRGLVLLEPPLHAKRHPSLNLLNGVVGSILCGALLGQARGGRRFSRWVFREVGGGNSLDRAGADVRAELDANAAAICRELRGGTGEHLSQAQLGAINCPTVAFSGALSQPFLQAGAERAARAVRNGQHRNLAETTHFIQLERFDEIAAAVQRLT